MPEAGGEKPADSVKLRPHHLLCIQGYRGKGYSPAFVENMDVVTERLRRESDLTVELVFSTDDICACCPRMRGLGLCQDDAKVRRYDRETAALLSLSEQRYSYQELEERVRQQGVGMLLRFVCGDCRWNGLCTGETGEEKEQPTEV